MGESRPVKRRIAFELPEGSLGVLILLVLAALSGGLIAAYWPMFFGGVDLGTTQDRLVALETRVGQLAAGHAGAAASGVFDDLRRESAALGQRLDAAEARLTALEKAAEQAGRPDADIAALRTKLDAAATALIDVTARVARLESAPRGVNGASVAEVASIAAKLNAAETRLAAVEGEVAHAAESLKGTVNGLDARLKALEVTQPPADLMQRLGAFALKTDEANIDTRLKSIEAENTADSLHRAAMVLALADLVRVTGEPGPFTLELDTFAAIAPNDPMVAALRPYAAMGAPAKAALIARFPATARVALDAERATQAHGFFEQLWANLMSLISVRRVGDVEGQDTQSRLARAQTRIDAGDLAAAATEVRALQGPAAAAAAPWLKDATARLTLDRAAADMNVRVIQALAAAAQAQSATATNAAPPPPPITAAPTGVPPVHPAPAGAPAPNRGGKP